MITHEVFKELLESSAREAGKHKAQKSKNYLAPPLNFLACTAELLHVLPPTMHLCIKNIHFKLNEYTNHKNLESTNLFYKALKGVFHHAFK